MSRQHLWRLSGGACGWEVYTCSKCGRSAIPSIFGFLWPSLAAWLPFCGRWRCDERYINPATGKPWPRWAGAEPQEL